MTVDKQEIAKEIEEIVSRETRAWDTQDVELLLSIFHPDMVWPWPPNPQAHDPATWEIPMGRFNYERWKQDYQDMFDTHKLAHNKRAIRRIEVSDEGDGAFAVLDIDTLWVDSDGSPNHWLGRVCKVYTRVDSKWKLIMHTGVLDYSLVSKDWSI
ncbi:MAG: nuclear transport factor 2 family protein [Candidatus Thorarchaeota archaeon]|nr:MAG: nuclear transport factor 2 family protein [Candidatus Thorarchaeota archaeon]